jgi:predicted DNA-binding transcriptional regulator YafY
MRPHIAKQPADSKGEKLAQRLSGILARLHQGEALDKHQLVQEFGVDVRTIERDLNQRLEGIAERNTDGLWQLAQASRATVPAKRLRDYARLTGTEHFFPDTSLRYLLEQLQTPEPRRATHVQPTQHEDLSAQGSLFTQLQGAIAQHQECRFTYKAKPRHAQPYRLIHKNGVWYLAAEEAGRLKNFSVALIEGLQVDEASRFNPKRAHHDYINAKDDVWFTESTTEVLLRVAPEVAHYFTRRPLLPLQQHRADSDGSLLITTHINHINQLLPVVRYWLPHVRIVRPMEWHEELAQSLRDILCQLNEMNR